MSMDFDLTWRPCLPAMKMARSTSRIHRFLVRSPPNEDLAGVRLIAEPWDAGGAYQLGAAGFRAVQWMQWNGNYRDCVQKLVRGDRGMVPEVMSSRQFGFVSR